MKQKEAVYSPEYGVGIVEDDENISESKNKKKAKFEDGKIREVDESCKDFLCD